MFACCADLQQYSNECHANTELIGSAIQALPAVFHMQQICMRQLSSSKIVQTCPIPRQFGDVAIQAIRRKDSRKEEVRKMGLMEKAIQKLEFTLM